MRFLSSILALGLAMPGLTGAQDVDYLEIGESLSRTDGAADGAFFSVVLEGSGIFSAGMVTPGGLSVPLFERFPGVFETQVPFETPADRVSKFPNGSYEFFLNGVSAGTVPFAPTVPNGFASVVSPVHRATGVALNPTFEFSNGCTNCTTIDSGASVPAALELGVFTVLTGATDGAAPRIRCSDSS